MIKFINGIIPIEDTKLTIRNRFVFTIYFLHRGQALKFPILYTFTGNLTTGNEI